MLVGRPAWVYVEPPNKAGFDNVLNEQDSRYYGGNTRQ